MQTRAQQICSEIDKFLRQYNRSVIQLKTLKCKLEEQGSSDSLFTAKTVTVNDMKEAINSCDMKQYLSKDTLNNYVKEKKSISLTTVTTSEEQKNSNPITRIPATQKVKPQQVGNQQFNKFLNTISMNLLQTEDNKINYNEQTYRDIKLICQEPEFNRLFEEYRSIFNEDSFILKQRLLLDIENIQMYLMTYGNVESQECQGKYSNVVFNIISKVVWEIQNNKDQNNDSIDMNYSIFSTQVQQQLSYLTSKNGEWQQQLFTNILHLIHGRDP